MASADQDKLGATSTPVAPEAGDRRTGTAGGPAERFRAALSMVLGAPLALPVTSIVYVPPAAAPVLLMVRVLLLPGATGLGEKLTVVPAGLPEADSVTGLLKPASEPTLTL